MFTLPIFVKKADFQLNARILFLKLMVLSFSVPLFPLLFPLYLRRKLIVISFNQPFLTIDLINYSFTFQPLSFWLQ